MILQFALSQKLDSSLISKNKKINFFITGINTFLSLQLPEFGINYEFSNTPELFKFVSYLSIPNHNDHLNYQIDHFINVIP